ncbi:MAG: hypothetical protein ABW091_16105 [Microbacterium sp.]
MSRRPEFRSASALARGVAVSFLIGTLAVTGCASTPDPAPSASTTSAPETRTPSATPSVPAEPVLVPAGSAADNLPLFTAVTNAVWAGPENVSGRAYIDALVAAGFDKAAMQVTYDETTVGNPAESIQFSVHWQQECLVGQVGPATGAPVAVVVPALAGGACLVGSTRPIDW